MTVEANLNGASYVAVEIIRKAAKRSTEIDSGLFMGICSRKDNEGEEYKFITIMTAKDTVKLFNKVEYDVVSFDVITYDTKCTTIFNKSDKDQDEAIEDLEKISNHMIEIEKMEYHNDTRKELIDPTYYKEYPNELVDKNEITKDTNKTNTTYNRESENKGPVLSKIKRKGKLPNKDKLDSMKDKVKKIASGEYKVDPIPVPDCDKKGEEKSFNYYGRRPN